MSPPVALLRLDPAAFRPFIVRHLARVLGLLLVVSQVVLIAMVVASGDPSFFFAEALVVFALGTSGLQTYARERAAWSSFELAVSETLLRRQVSGAETIELFRRDIAAIHDEPGRGVTLRARDGRALFVPASVTRFEELRDELLTWGPIVPPPKGSSAEIVASVAMVGCWFGTWIPDLRIALSFGVGLLLLGARAIVVATRNPAFDARTRSVLYSVYGFMLLSPIARVVFVVVTRSMGVS